MSRKSRENNGGGGVAGAQGRVNVIADLIQNGGLVSGLEQLMPRAQEPFPPGSRGYFRLLAGAGVNYDLVERVSGQAEQVVEQCVFIVSEQLGGKYDGVDVVGRVRQAVYGVDTTLDANPQNLARKLIDRMGKIGAEVAEIVAAQELQRRFVEAGGEIPEPEKVFVVGDEYGLPPVEEKILACGWRVGSPKPLDELEQSGNGVPHRDLIDLIRRYGMKRVLGVAYELGPGREVVLISAGVKIAKSPNGWQEVAAEFNVSSCGVLYNMRTEAQNRLRKTLSQGKGLGGDAFDWENYFAILNQGVEEWRGKEVDRIKRGRNI